jgi:hypothetical protein
LLLLLLLLLRLLRAPTAGGCCCRLPALLLLLLLHGLLVLCFQLQYCRLPLCPHQVDVTHCDTHSTAQRSRKWREQVGGLGCRGKMPCLASCLPCFTPCVCTHCAVCFTLMQPQLFNPPTSHTCVEQGVVQVQHQHQPLLSNQPTPALVGNAGSLMRGHLVGAVSVTV